MSTDQSKTARTYDDLEVGDSYRATHFISEQDVRAFAQITGDDNPIHVDEEFARQTQFGHRIVHGVLLLGIVSKVLGRDYPGHGSIAISVTSRFLRPVPVNSEITIEYKVTEKLAKHKHIKGRICVYHDGKRALVGETIVIPPGNNADERR
jgi:acyl dehydratase